MHEILGAAERTTAFVALQKELNVKSNTVYLNELVGGALSFYMAAAVSRVGGLHVLVAEDKDAAAYAMNDLYALLGEERVLFFPSSYKRSIVYGREEQECVVMRTGVLNALRQLADGEFLVVCTYPEALSEGVVDESALTAPNCGRQSPERGRGERMAFRVYSRR